MHKLNIYLEKEQINELQNKLLTKDIFVKAFGIRLRKRKKILGTKIRA